MCKDECKLAGVDDQSDLPVEEVADATADEDAAIDGVEGGDAVE